MAKGPIIRVAGGTGAGRRPPFNGRPKDWECLCIEPAMGVGFVSTGEAPLEPLPARKVNPGFLRRCPGCGEERPNG